MPSSLIRLAKAASVLLVVPVTGVGFDGGSGSAPAGRPATAGYPQAFVSQERMAVVDPDKKLSAGDEVTVEIVEDREGGLARVVTATGELDVPPLGRVRVSGQTASDAASNIKRLLEKDYYYTATVRLSIDRISKVAVQQGSVQLSGQVRMVGQQFLIAGEQLTVTGAILKAGGVTEWGNAKKIQVTRQKKDGTSEKFEVDFKKITETGDVKADPVLQDGDRIYIPKIIFRPF